MINTNTPEKGVFVSPSVRGGIRGVGLAEGGIRRGTRRQPTTPALPPYQKCIAFFFFFFFVFYNLIKYGGGLLPRKIRICLINKNSGRLPASAGRGR